MPCAIGNTGAKDDSRTVPEEPAGQSTNSPILTPIILDKGIRLPDEVK
jgi:hypothetical protein